MSVGGVLDNYTKTRVRTTLKPRGLGGRGQELEVVQVGTKTSGNSTNKTVVKAGGGGGGDENKRKHRSIKKERRMHAFGSDKTRTTQFVSVSVWGRVRRGQGRCCRGSNAVKCCCLFTIQVTITRL